MIYVLIIGAMIFGHFVTATGVSQGLVNYASHLSPLGMITLVCIIFYILGALLDESPLLLILVPLLYPLVVKAGLRSDLVRGAHHRPLHGGDSRPARGDELLCGKGACRR